MVRQVCGDFKKTKVKFVKIKENLSNVFPREGLLPSDLDKIYLKNVKILDFVDHLPKDTFTLEEWSQFCVYNP